MSKNPWLAEKGRVSLPEGTVVSTHVDKLSLTDKIHYQTHPEARLDQPQTDDSQTQTQEASLQQTPVVIDQGISTANREDLTFYSNAENTYFDSSAKAEEIVGAMDISSDAYVDEMEMV